MSGDNQTHSGTTASLDTVNLQTSVGSQAHIQSSTSALIASGMQADGQLVNARSLNVQADGQVQLAGKTLTTDALTLTGQGVDVSQGQLSAHHADWRATQNDVTASGSQVQIATNLHIQTPRSLITDKAHLETAELNLEANTWRNIGGTFTHTSDKDLHIQLQGNLDNTQGILQTNSQNLSVQANQLLNQEGVILHQGHGQLSVTVQSLDNTVKNKTTKASRITSQGNTALQIQDTFVNQGLVYGFGNLQIDTGSLSNQGSLVARGDQTIHTQSLSASQDSLIAAGMTGDGQLAALSNGSTRLSIQAAQALQNAGQMQAYGTIDIAGSSLDLQQALVANKTGDLS
mgnify:CR=1 FL=1